MGVGGGVRGAGGGVGGGVGWSRGGGAGWGAVGWGWGGTSRHGGWGAGPVAVWGGRAGAPSTARSRTASPMDPVPCRPPGVSREGQAGPEACWTLLCPPLDAQDGPPRGPCHHSSPPPRSAPGSREGAPRGKPRRSKQDEATGGRLRPGRARFPPFPGLLAGAPGRKPTQGLGGSPRARLGSEAKGQPKGGCRGRQGPAPSTPTGPPRPRQAPASRVLRAMGGHGGQDAGRAAPHPRGEGPRLGGPCGQGPGSRAGGLCERQAPPAGPPCLRLGSDDQCPRGSDGELRRPEGDRPEPQARERRRGKTRPALSLPPKAALDLAAAAAGHEPGGLLGQDRPSQAEGPSKAQHQPPPRQEGRSGGRQAHRLPGGHRRLRWGFPDTGREGRGSGEGQGFGAHS